MTRPRDQTDKFIAELKQDAKEKLLKVKELGYTGLQALRALSDDRNDDSVELQTLPVKTEARGTNDLNSFIGPIESDFAKPLATRQQIFDCGAKPADIATGTERGVSEIDGALAGSTADEQEIVGQPEEIVSNEAFAEHQAENLRLKQERDNAITECDLMRTELDVARTERDVARTERDNDRTELDGIKANPAFIQLIDRLKKEADQKERRELKKKHNQRRADVAAQAKKEMEELVARQMFGTNSHQPEAPSGTDESGQAVPVSAGAAHRTGVEHAEPKPGPNAQRGFKGRKPSYSRDQFAMACNMLDQDVKISIIAKETGLSRQTVYRINEDRAAAEAVLADWGM